MQGNEVSGTTHNQNKIIDILSSWLLASGLANFGKYSATIIHWLYSFTAGFRKIAIST
jgi:hypothetical protein